VSGAERGEPIAVVGMACRYADADDPIRLWETVLAGRRAFRRLPPQRVDLADYFDQDPTAPDRIYSTQAAVLADWRFDRSAFRIPGRVFRAADPVHWLALETADRALRDAGHPMGQGLDRDRVAVVVGNSLGGEVTRARTLRLRWPYVRGILESTLPVADRDAVIDRVAQRYLSAFPEVDDETLAGGLANTIAGRICNQFDFHGGGYTVDGACASSMLAVITVCRALRDGSADFGIAGGVDLSLDPFELVGFAKTGALAAEDMRVYDERSAGFWPGEGCGMLALMRASDARAAGALAYAEILGWATSSDGRGGITRPEVDGQVRAQRLAAGMAGVHPADIGLYEGHGTGTAVGDAVELAALNHVRAEASKPAALGSVKANIGHTKAAAAVAGVIKVALSIASGVLPPTTGCRSPHSGLGDGLRVLADPEPWAPGHRIAGVSAMGFGGINAHLVLGEADSPRPVPSITVGARVPDVEVVAVSGSDTASVRAVLDRIAERAPRLSRAELHDLACQLGRLTPAGPVRAAVLARTPEELGARSERAARALSDLAKGVLWTSPGVWLGNEVAGRVTLLFPGQGVNTNRPVDTALVQPEVHRSSLSAVDRLDELGVTATAAIGHSLGEITALVWAGRLSRQDGERLVRERGRLMAELGVRDTGMLAVETDAAGARTLCEGTGLVVAVDNGPLAQVLAGPVSELRVAAKRAGVAATMLPVSHAFHSAAMAECREPLRTVLRTMVFQPASRSVVSTVYGRALGDDEDLVAALVAQVLAPVRFWPAVQSALADTDLFCEVGPGHALTTLVAAGTRTAAVSMDIGSDHAAALFAASAAKDLAPLFAGRFSRPLDLWRDPEFLANPCSATPAAAPPPRPVPPLVPARLEPAAVVTALLAEAIELDPMLIRSDTTLLGDLNLSSLRTTQLVAAAAVALGRRAPAGAERLIDATVADLISTIESLPAAGGGEDQRIRGVAPWIRCFHETLVPTTLPAEPAEVVYLPDPEDVDAVLEAGRTALRTKALVVLTHDPALSGFLRSVHLEHPDVGITLVRVPRGHVDPLRVGAEPGCWQELIVGTDGTLSEPVERLLPRLGSVDRIPFGADDVVLVSGGGRGIGYECARALAKATGVALAVIGRSSPETDESLRVNLDRLRSEGIRVAYRSVDVADCDAVRAVLAELGPVDAILHASGINEPAGFDHLGAEKVRRHLRPKVTGLRALLAAVDPSRLRLVVCFGSVIGRHGLPGESHYALANGVLRAAAERLAQCRVLNIEWSVWSGAGMGERLGVVDRLADSDVTPIPVSEGVELFLRLLSTPDLPVTVSVRGRLGPGASSELAGRFLERVRVHHPGIELIADSALSVRRDPCLRDHRLDGLTLLPGVVGVEAMAQAASALVGRALTVAERVELVKPVMITDTGERTVRVCALLEGNVISTVLRSDETDFQIDHFSATFPLSVSENLPCAITVDSGPVVDADELYGPVFFHAGQFRRVAAVSLPDPRSCRATVTADGGWFDSVFGSPTVNDASVHVLQACVPHRRLLPLGCDRIEVDPSAVGTLDLRAVERACAGGRYTWDVVATDASARVAVRWTGLRLLDIGPLARARPWPAALLAVMLERAATGLGLDPSLRVSAHEPLSITVTADHPAACDWQPVGPWREPADADLLTELSGPCPEPPDTLAARVRTATRCLDRIGSAGLRFAGIYDGGWLLLKSADAVVASVVVTVAGVTGPVAVSVLTTGGRR